MKLQDLALCAECDQVFEIGPDACPSCLCTQFFYLSSLVKPKEVREEINLARFMEKANRQ